MPTRRAAPAPPERSPNFRGKHRERNITARSKVMRLPERPIRSRRELHSPAPSHATQQPRFGQLLHRLLRPRHEEHPVPPRLREEVRGHVDRVRLTSTPADRPSAPRTTSTRALVSHHVLARHESPISAVLRMLAIVAHREQRSAVRSLALPHVVFKHVASARRRHRRRSLREIVAVGTCRDTARHVLVWAPSADARCGSPAVLQPYPIARQPMTRLTYVCRVILGIAGTQRCRRGSTSRYGRIAPRGPRGEKASDQPEVVAHLSKFPSIEPVGITYACTSVVVAKR